MCQHANIHQTFINASEERREPFSRSVISAYLMGPTHNQSIVSSSPKRFYGGCHRFVRVRDNNYHKCQSYCRSDGLFISHATANSENTYIHEKGRHRCIKQSSSVVITRARARKRCRIVLRISGADSSSAIELRYRAWIYTCTTCRLQGDMNPDYVRNRLC